MRTRHRSWGISGGPANGRTSCVTCTPFELAPRWHIRTTKCSTSRRISVSTGSLQRYPLGILSLLEYPRKKVAFAIAGPRGKGEWRGLPSYHPRAWCGDRTEGMREVSRFLGARHYGVLCHPEGVQTFFGGLGRRALKLCNLNFGRASDSEIEQNFPLLIRKSSISCFGG